MRPRPGLVSVVLVNYKGVEDTLACIRAFDDVDWPRERLEIVVVDNASGDGSLERLRAEAPDVVVVASDRNLGFAGGCNLGVERSHGEVVAFVNNDARPDRAFLSAAVPVLEKDLGVGAVATKVLDWEGERIDFVDAALSWYGQGFKLHVGEEASADGDAERDILFGTGSSLLVRRSAFEELGGFDEDYFMFFEDVDLGWRLWLAGYRVRYVPASITFHRHHASMSTVGSWREKYLLERNALYTIYKNYDDENLTRLLPGALALSVRRGVVLGGDDPDALDLAGGNPPGETDEMTISRTAAASAYAVDAFTRHLPELQAKRERVQDSRRRTDAEILRMFGRPLQPNIDHPEFLRAYTSVVDAFGVEDVFSERRRILVATGDTLTPRMAGPAIRAWQIASALSREHDVRLVTTAACDLRHPAFEIAHASPAQIAEHERWADVIVFQGYLMHEQPSLKHTRKIVVVDIYDPFHLEQLEQARDLGEQGRRDTVQSATAVLNEQILRGDFFMCASEKQRDFWLGQMAGLGRINPSVYDQDASLGSLLSVVPFGVSDEPPVASRPMVKGVIDGIGPDDKVVLWGGGIYNWFDPLTLIRAIDKVREVVPEVRLLFMGVKHPNPAVPQMRMAVEAERLAESLGLAGSHVIFNREWVRYDERVNFLLESDVGVSTHFDHVETAFSFRTRILDYFWASLPIVATRGDSLADLIEQRDLGITVPAEDVDALADALVQVLTDEERRARHRANIEQLVPGYRWSVVLDPLVQFCRRPHRAPDLLDAGVVARMSRGVGVVPPRWKGVGGDVRLVKEYLAEGGPRLLASKVRSRTARLVRGRPSDA